MDSSVDEDDWLAAATATVQQSRGEVVGAAGWGAADTLEPEPAVEGGDDAESPGSVQRSAARTKGSKPAAGAVVYEAGAGAWGS